MRLSRVLLCGAVFLGSSVPATGFCQQVVNSDLSKIPISALTFEETMTQAKAAYSSKDYANGADLYLMAYKRSPEALTALYNAACCYALLGDSAKAFAGLDQLIREGYSNGQQTEQDQDFNSLHSSPRWTGVLAAIKENDAKGKNFWDGPAFATNYRSDLSEDERIAGLTKFWEEVKHGFANFQHVPEVYWDKLYIEYLPKVRAASSIYEYYQTMKEFCSHLEDGHTNVYPPWQLDSMYARPAFRTRLIGGRVIVTRVTDTVQYEGIEQGMEITAIDGMPVRDYAARYVAPYISASSPQDRDVRLYDFEMLVGPQARPIELTLKDAKGTTRTRTISRLDRKTRAAAYQRANYAPQPFEFKILPDNIALVTLNTFETPKTADNFIAAFPDIARSNAMIIDIRENGGGSDGIANRILACLTDKPFRGEEYVVRTYSAADRSHGIPEGKRRGSNTNQPNGTLLYKKPVAVLTSPRTYSASEDFLAGFVSMKRGPVVGEATGGSTGNPLFFKLPGGGQARVCTMHFALADGTEFIGKGIQPTIPVTPTVEGFRAGRDEVLEKAIQTLSEP